MRYWQHWSARSPDMVKPALYPKPKQPVTPVSVRVIGVPASGDNLQQAFASCAELQAFSE
jgi:hypothetical protein